MPPSARDLPCRASYEQAGPGEEGSPVLDVIPLSEAARRLRIPYYRAHKLLFTGQLEPAQRRGSYWYASDQAGGHLLDQQAVVPTTL